MKRLKLTSKMPVSVNHYLGYRTIPSKRNGKTFHMVVPYLTKEAKEYKEYFSNYAQKEVEKQDWDIEQTRTKHHYMDCVYYFPRIDMDEQNYPKTMSDALNEIAYIDDNFILTRTHRVYYDSKNPRVEISIYPVEYTGIFDNNEDLAKFVDVCKGCKRYARNCSILKKAVEGRIQEEIDETAKEKKCSKFSANNKKRIE